MLDIRTCCCISIGQVVENSSPGLLISRLSATDADSGAYGQLRYELRGFGAERFAVNSSTGDLSVAVCGLATCLDYEEQDSYTLTYTAIDGGGKFHSISEIGVANLDRWISRQSYICSGHDQY